MKMDFIILAAMTGPSIADPSSAVKIGNGETETIAYGQYAFDQIEELIAKYHQQSCGRHRLAEDRQAIAGDGRLLQRHSDGVVDDRFGVKHSDFQSPEYRSAARSAK